MYIEKGEKGKEKKEKRARQKRYICSPDSIFSRDGKFVRSNIFELLQSGVIGETRAEDELFEYTMGLIMDIMVV